MAELGHHSMLVFDRWSVKSSSSFPSFSGHVFPPGHIGKWFQCKEIDKGVRNAWRWDWREKLTVVRDSVTLYIRNVMYCCM